MNIQNALDKILSLCKKADKEGRTSWERKSWLGEPIDPDDPEVGFPYVLKEGLVVKNGVHDIIAELRERGFDVFYDNGYDWYTPVPGTLRVSWTSWKAQAFLVGA